MLLLHDEESITPAHFAPHLGVEGPTGVRFVLPPEGVVLEEVEKELIQQALDRTDGNKAGAAGLLGLTRDTLRYRLEKYAID